MSYQTLVRLKPREGATGRILGPAGALLGALMWEAHPILGGLAGYTLARNGTDVVTGDKTLGEAAEAIGTQGAAVAASAALPAFPVLGYVGGRIAGKIALPRLVDEAQKQSAFLERPVHVFGSKDYPMWKVALAGGGLLAVGYGLHHGIHHVAKEKATEYAKSAWAKVRGFGE